MSEASGHGLQERRRLDRSRGITLRRRLRELVDSGLDRRRSDHSGFDIAAALELHLDQCTTRRAMLVLLESWLYEAKNGKSAEHDESYAQAIEHAMAVMRSAPDPLTGIAVLQRRGRPGALGDDDA